MKIYNVNWITLLGQFLSLGHKITMLSAKHPLGSVLIPALNTSRWVHSDEISKKKKNNKKKQGMVQSQLFVFLVGLKDYK